MSSSSSIEWTEATWNPVTGCTKVSPGCAHCYAETFAERWRGIPGHPYEQGFDLKLWHTFQVLTKRPDRMRDFVRAWEATGGGVLPNVWLGTSIENRRFVHRADILRETPAAVRFISAEPLLGPLVPAGPFHPGSGPPCPLCARSTDGWWDRRRPLCLSCAPHLDLTGIDWLIVGGESGPKHRPVAAAWVRDLRDAAQATGTAFFFKQWGGPKPKSGGRLLDGRTWDEMPVARQAALA